MALLSEAQRAAAERSLCSGSPFALWRMPGDTEAVFLGSESTDTPIHDISFSIAPWVGDRSPVISYTMDGVTDPGILDTEIVERQTSKSQYLRDVRALIKTLKAQAAGHKVVVSRTTILPLRAMSVFDLFESLVQRASRTLVYVLFHPAIGGWIGATPELLLSSHADRVRTMALAGTRSVGYSDGAWDAKNIEEQAIVRRYIVETLRAYCSEIDVAPTTNLIADNVEHICSLITGVLKPDCSYEIVADALNPTPAVCGNPRHEALEMIAACERHRRRYYSGTIDIVMSERRYTFVNLRCARFDAQKMCIYTGGGITADSIATMEWYETEVKARPLALMLRFET